MSDLATRYPRSIQLPEGEAVIARMSAADESDVLAFGRSLPRHDLLFLRRDITEPRVLSAWVRELEEGSIHSLVARREGALIGCSAVVRDLHSWSPHVGELRVLLAPGDRSRGLGRILIQESFLVALDLGLEKLTAQMTPDQTAAIAVFEDLGFRGEALLRDQVRDADGVKHDIVILAHDVLRFAAQMDAYGVVDEAF
ncbi:MAG: GNAT family N-acetyltransferase [Pseudomonadales bacterium]|jgi:L-amino acid N-acyltransferase YncA|nr:GNAT family N-acetyltransferase [Pseudomonadales bacterium]